MSIGNVIALFTAGCFCVLASYAMGEANHRHYTARPVVISRVIPSWNAKQATIASIFNITPEEAAKPVNIFGE